MATISKSVLLQAKEMVKDDFKKEDIAKALQLIYNAGYRMGLKASRTVSRLPTLEEVD